jgi:hypothetical protein
MISLILHSFSGIEDSESSPPGTPPLINATGKKNISWMLVRACDAGAGVNQNQAEQNCPTCYSLSSYGLPKVAFHSASQRRDAENEKEGYPAVHQAYRYISADRKTSSPMTISLKEPILKLRISRPWSANLTRISPSATRRTSPLRTVQQDRCHQVRRRRLLGRIARWLRG